MKAMKKMKENFKKRPLSWSQINNFKYNPDKWYKKYILDIKDEISTPEQDFGKIFAKSCEDRKPLAPVTLYSEVEYPIFSTLEDIPMIGYIDTYEPLKAFIDHKTGAKEWTQKRANEHGQLKMYALMLYLNFKIKPEDLNIAIEWVKTEKKDNVVSLSEPITVSKFNVDISTADILIFGNYIKTTVNKMERYAQAMS